MLGKHFVGVEWGEWGEGGVAHAGYRGNLG